MLLQYKLNMVYNIRRMNHLNVNALANCQCYVFQLLNILSTCKCVYVCVLFTSDEHVILQNNRLNDAKHNNFPNEMKAERAQCA